MREWVVGQFEKVKIPPSECRYKSREFETLREAHRPPCGGKQECPSKLRASLCHLQTDPLPGGWPLLQCADANGIIGRPCSEVAFMSHAFDFDPANRILRCRFSGTVTDEELKDYYQQAAAIVKAIGEPAAGIADFSAVTKFAVAKETVLGLANSAPILREPKAVRIIIAATPTVFGMARMFEITGESTRPNSHVVKTEQEAWAILGVWEPKFEPVKQG
jgi:hypothetical protein